jgi:GT2 family glycosyltransferase
MMFTIPFAERPRASLIVVTWNAVEWTRRAIEAIAAHTATPFELIVVDNASTDGTRDFLGAELAGASILLNDRNLGFGVGANIGAMRASAPVLVFVNSDLLVMPGWLEPLCSRIEEDPHVAAAGPTIIGLHGRIDHAGGLMGHDGWTMHYGEGDEAEKPEYGFRRRADYLTGACLAVRTRSFRDAGGFDPLFEIAYFEDVDLCLRLRDDGLAVVYEPSSVVTHAGGASGTTEGSLRLLGVNQPRFAQRWRDLLASRPEAPLTARPERIAGARDIVVAGTVLLMTDPTDFSLELTETLREAGCAVEAPRRIDREWLETRRYHFDIIVGAGTPDIETLIEDTQPQACRTTMEALRSDLGAALSEATIVL